MAEHEGADALLIFPSAAWDMGHQLRPDMAYGYIADIAAATSLPVIVFVYPVSSGLHIPTDNLVRICGEIQRRRGQGVVDEHVTYERNYRELKSLDKDIAVLSSFSKALLASLCVGADGILSGHGSMIATCTSSCSRRSRQVTSQRRGRWRNVYIRSPVPSIKTRS